MHRNTLSILLILSVFLSSNVFAASGDLQVTCEPSIRIFIDGNFKGVTNDSDNGLFIENLSPGKHTLKAIKKGFDPFVRDISIIASRATEVKISFGQRQEKVKSLQPEEGQTLNQVGRLELRSVPLGAKVYIDGKSYQLKNDIEIENFPIGQHRITFERGKQKLAGLFNLEENETLKLKAHFKEGRIIDLSKIEEEETEIARQEAERARIAAQVEAERKRLEWERRETGRDGRFITYANGTVLDTRTNLMWADRDNGSNISWPNAKNYCENYRGGGYTDWRMPTKHELAELYLYGDNSISYKPQHSLYLIYLATKAIQLTSGFVWSSETSGSDTAYAFKFDGNKWYSAHQSRSYITHTTLPVRNAP